MINKRPPFPKCMPADVQGIMKDCLEANPEDRPSAEEIDHRLKRINNSASLLAGTSMHGALKPKDPNVSLFDIFPKHVAEALRDGRKVEPEHRDSVTIFFSDIVGFTNISSTLDPRKVANLLDRLYHKFDDLSHEFDVFKVETIGTQLLFCASAFGNFRRVFLMDWYCVFVFRDAYMAVTNLVKVRYTIPDRSSFITFGAHPKHFSHVYTRIKNRTMPKELPNLPWQL